MDRWITARYAFLSVLFLPQVAFSVPLTILHTNDIHSHFQAEKGGDRLGGVARLKTQIDRIRQSTSQSVLLDGGDWAEGNTYYLAGTGKRSIELMALMGYDAAVVGNHDWINGPDALLDSIAFNHGMRLLSANIDASQYARQNELHEYVKPTSLQILNGIRIAYIGVSTYEIIYDSFFKPVKVLSPFGMIHDLAKNIRDNNVADIIIAISHNGLKLNTELAEAAPDLDLIIGAHDHVKLLKPIEVTQPEGRVTWIVEAEKWGKFLGRVDLDVDLETHTPIQFKSYKLYPIENTLPENSEIKTFVDRIDQEIERTLPWSPSDHVATLSFPLGRKGPEPLMGNIATDAYRAATHADITLDNIAFIYGSLYPGEITKRDVFDANPAVWNPSIQKAWTLQKFSLKGRTLTWLLNLFYSHSMLVNHGLLNHSGLDVTFEPAFTSLNDSAYPGSDTLPLPMDPRDPLWSLGRPVVRNVKIGGELLDLDRTYSIAAPTGVIEAIRFIDRIFPGMIPLDDLNDTSIESWRAIADYLSVLNHPIPEDIPVGRSHITGPDLALLDAYTFIQNDYLRVRIKNLGQSPIKKTFSVRVEEDLSFGDESSPDSWSLIQESEINKPLSPDQTLDLDFKGLQWTSNKAKRRKVRVQVIPPQEEIRSLNNTIERTLFLN